MLLIAYMEYLAWNRACSNMFPVCYQEFLERWQGKIPGSPGYW